MQNEPGRNLTLVSVIPNAFERRRRAAEIRATLEQAVLILDTSVQRVGRASKLLGPASGMDDGPRQTATEAALKDIRAAIDELLAVANELHD